MLGFDRRLEEADAVVTGEGRFDGQSLQGKLVGEIARRCRRARVPLHVIAGEVAMTLARNDGVLSYVEAGDLDGITAAAEAIALGPG
jgi:glycerate kinase